MPGVHQFRRAVRVECLGQIGDMQRRAHRRAVAERGFADPDAPFAQRLHPLRGHAEGGLGHEDFLGFVEFVDRAFIGLRELHRAADDGGKHGVEIERGIHRAQHFLQRLEFGDRAGQCGGAFAQFPEGVGTADGDDGLFGEGFQQFDLVVGEATDLLAVQRHRTDGSAVAQQRQRQGRLRAQVPHGRKQSGFGVHIRNMDDLPVQDRAAREGSTGRLHGKHPLESRDRSSISSRGRARIDQLAVEFEQA